MISEGGFEGLKRVVRQEKKKSRPRERAVSGGGNAVKSTEAHESVTWSCSSDWEGGHLWAVAGRDQEGPCRPS